jgi:hypothetical protein
VWSRPMFTWAMKVCRVTMAAMTLVWLSITPCRWGACRAGQVRGGQGRDERVRTSGEQPRRKKEGASGTREG